MNLNKSTLSDQIYQILRADILQGDIPLGTKLTLKTLKERFEVSSTPIREALTRLTEEGLVRYYSNIGVNVIDLSEEDLKELYQFMGDLDALAITYSFSHPDRAKICADLEATLAVTTKLEAVRQSRPLTKEETDTWILYSDRFHLIFYDYCRNSRLKHAAERLRAQLTIFSNIYERQAAPQEQIFHMHQKIYEAYQSGDVALASERMRQHLMDSLAFSLQEIQKD